MNPLNQYPQIRSALYLVQWIVTGLQVVLGAFFGFYYGMPEDWPQWFLASLAVAPVLWSYLGVTAKANVDPLPYDHEEYEDEETYEEAGGLPFPQEEAYRQGTRLYQPGSDEDGFGGDAPEPRHRH